MRMKTLLAFAFVITSPITWGAEMGVGREIDGPDDVTEEPETTTDDFWQAMLDWFEPEPEDAQ